jgi:uncharacterized protein YifE (UPF0438 family)
MQGRYRTSCKPCITISNILRKERKELKELRREKAENEAHEKLKQEALKKLAQTQARKAAVKVIERYWSKYLWKLEMRRARERLRKLPSDCRAVWIELHYAKAKASDLRQEIDDLIHNRLSKD